MTLDLKYIANLNLRHKPFFSPQFQKEKWRNEIESILRMPLQVDEDELVVLCLEGLYGYRTGIIGYLLTSLANIGAPYLNTYVLKFLLNSIFSTKFDCTDLELISGLISIFNRQLLFLNYGMWDYKSNLFGSNHEMWKYSNSNESMPGIFNYCSNLLMKPFYDSGIHIVSNQPVHASGFEASENNRNNVSVNEGFAWCYYKKEKKGIMVITLNISDDEDKEVKLKEITQLKKLHDRLTMQFTFDVLRYETYIVGNFKTRIDDYRNVFENFKISNAENTSYMIYKNYNLRNSFVCNTKTSLSDENLLVYRFFRKRMFCQTASKFIFNKRFKKESSPQELKEVKVDTFEDIEKNKDESVIQMYKSFSNLDVPNPLQNSLNPIPESQLDEIELDKEVIEEKEVHSNSSTDEEWTKV